MHHKLKGSPGVYLVGFMGSGKSTTGPLLAERLGWSFVDLDDEIERLAGMSISQLFESLGEPAFRAVERWALEIQRELVLRGRARVVALGGGAFAQRAIADRIRDAGLSVWLAGPAEQLWERVKDDAGRPLAQNEQRFRELHASREESYSEADLRVDVRGSVGSVVDEILGHGLV